MFAWPRVTAVPVWFSGLGGTWLRPSAAQLAWICAKASNPGSKWAPEEPASVPPFFPLASDLNGVCQGLRGGCRGPKVCQNSSVWPCLVENEGPLLLLHFNLALFFLFCALDALMSQHLLEKFYFFISVC